MSFLISFLSKRVVGKGTIPLLLVLLSVGIVLALPSDAPIALASRLFESPVETPTVEAPTAIPEVPTATPEVPTATPEAPGPSPEPLPSDTPEVSKPTPMPAEPTATETRAPELPPAMIEAEPTPAPSPQVNWARFIDTVVLVFSHFWLACGVVVLLSVIVLLVVLWLRSRRAPAGDSSPDS